MKVPSLILQSVHFYYHGRDGRFLYQAVIAYNVKDAGWYWYIYATGKLISAPVKEHRTNQFKTDTRARQIIRLVLENISSQH